MWFIRVNPKAQFMRAKVKGAEVKGVKLFFVIFMQLNAQPMPP